MQEALLRPHPLHRPHPRPLGHRLLRHLQQLGVTCFPSTQAYCMQSGPSLILIFVELKKAIVPLLDTGKVVYGFSSYPDILAATTISLLPILNDESCNPLGSFLPFTHPSLSPEIEYGPKNPSGFLKS